jgi:hypothetical protein
MQSAQSSTNTLGVRRRWLPAMTCALLMASLSACGGGMSGSYMASAPPAAAPPPAATPPPPTAAPAGCTASTCGPAVMTITDAAGDFLAYKVNLVSLQLKKADGTLVETLPATTAVDFVQLINLSEIISARQVPSGEYVAAQVTVDFTNAVIMVDDGTGTGVAVKPVDSTGAALGQLQLMVQLDTKNQLKMSPATTSKIAFDFNLLASNMVDLTAKTDTVSPVLVASVVPIDNKQIRVRGEIAAVDTANSDYTVNVDPFNNHDNDKLSPLVVSTTDTTTFEINGMPFAGAAGLAQLALLPADTVAVAFGNLSSDQKFTATSVLAGTSVQGGGLDHLLGNVIARTGNTLTIHGARMDGRDGKDDDDFISGNSTVTIAATTSVTAQGQSSATPAHTIAEISVGSLIDAFGMATKDNSGKITLDATAGRVRLDFTQVQGSLDASGTGNITLNLRTIDGQPVSLFSFTGTGSVTGVDTDPSNYVVATGALDVSPFSIGGSVLGIGFVGPFGTAPPDFTAVTIANGTIGNNGNCNGNSGGSGSNNCVCNGNNDGGNNNCMCNGNSGGSGSNNCMCNGNSGDGGGNNNNCTCNGNNGNSGTSSDGGGNGGNNNCTCNGNNGNSGNSGTSSDGGGNGGNNNCTCNSNNGNNGNSGNSGTSSDGGGNGGNNNCPNVQAAELNVDWGNSGTATPFKTLAPAGLDLDRSNPSIGSNHEIEMNQGNINIESLSSDVSITGAGSGMVLFSITGQHGRATVNFSSFADFETALAADLDGTTMALRLTAEGQYDSAGNTFTAQRITILLSN